MLVLLLEPWPQLEPQVRLERQVQSVRPKWQVKPQWAQRKLALLLGAARAWPLPWVKRQAERAALKVQRQDLALWLKREPARWPMRLKARSLKQAAH